MTLIIVKIILIILGLSYMIKSLNALYKVKVNEKDDILFTVKCLVEKKLKSKLDESNTFYNEKKSYFSNKFLRIFIYSTFILVFISGLFLIFLAAAC